MEYQKIINLLDNTPNQPFIFRTKNLILNHVYNNDGQIRFKNSMIRSSL